MLNTQRAYILWHTAFGGDGGDGGGNDDDDGDEPNERHSDKHVKS